MDLEVPMRSFFALSLLALASVGPETAPAATVTDPTGPRPDPGLPIRFEHAHGTASARMYSSSPGSRQRKRRKAQRQGGGR